MKRKTLFPLLIALCVPISAKDVRLRIEQGLNKGAQYMTVDENIGTLHFEKPSYVTRIERLEQLQNFKTITFDSTACIKDFSFLSAADNSKRS